MLGTTAVGKEEYPILISFFTDAGLEKSFVVKLHFKHIYHLALNFHKCSSCRAVVASDMEQCVGKHAFCRPLFTVCKMLVLLFYLTFHTFYKC